LTKYQRLNREFFSGETKQVASELLGTYLIRETERSRIVGRIIEVEAYLGSNDKACHSYNLKKTERTKVMYQIPGTLYVYIIYGLHHCLNVITEPEGLPCAVLIRQLYPVEGIDKMVKNRDVAIRKNYKNLVDGPGKLCQAFNITKNEFNGKDSCSSGVKLYFAQGYPLDYEIIIKSKRIGIEYAEEDKDLLLRYTLVNDKNKSIH
jgi:DNA-3-methyladenine glycosylase